jgi:CheY-like chemotaxis protein
LRYRDYPDAAVARSPDAPRRASSRLLLVEDELMVGMFMQDLLKTLGYQSTNPIGRLSDAIAAASNERFAGAVLDMNLNGEFVYPLADLLTKQEVPFVFVTGYASNSVDPRFSSVPILQKPVLQDELAGALGEILEKPKAIKQGVSAA